MNLAITLAALASLLGDARVPELGRVDFGRDLERGLARAKESSKPVFLLFQEIPGCATCRGFGRGPLTHPVLVEAIETSFVPVVIHNNAGGSDAEALRRFEEPAWNNPVVRFVDARGQDIVPRRDGVWSESAMSARMVEALARTPAKAPAWLELVRDELDSAPPARALFGMHCFWEGQGKLGAIDGVIDARPVFAGGEEACAVTFRPERTSYSELLKQARALECASTVFALDAEQEALAKSQGGSSVERYASTPRAAPDSDDLRSLRADRALMSLPLTRAQRVRANALLRAGIELEGRALTPRQAAMRVALERALKSDPQALEGLAYPSDASQLGAYEDEVRARLGFAR